MPMPSDEMLKVQNHNARFDRRDPQYVRKGQEQSKPKDALVLHPNTNLADFSKVAFASMLPPIMLGPEKHKDQVVDSGPDPLVALAIGGVFIQEMMKIYDRLTPAQKGAVKIIVLVVTAACAVIPRTISPTDTAIRSTATAPMPTPDSSRTPTAVVTAIATPLPDSSSTPEPQKTPGGSILNAQPEGAGGPGGKVDIFGANRLLDEGKTVFVAEGGLIGSTVTMEDGWKYTSAVVPNELPALGTLVSVENGIATYSDGTRIWVRFPEAINNWAWGGLFLDGDGVVKGAYFGPKGEERFVSGHMYDPDDKVKTKGRATVIVNEVTKVIDRPIGEQLNNVEQLTTNVAAWNSGETQIPNESRIIQLDGKPRELGFQTEGGSGVLSVGVLLGAREVLGNVVGVVGYEDKNGIRYTIAYNFGEMQPPFNDLSVQVYRSGDTEKAKDANNQKVEALTGLELIERLNKFLNKVVMIHTINNFSTWGDLSRLDQRMLDYLSQDFEDAKILAEYIKDRSKNNTQTPTPPYGLNSDLNGDINPNLLPNVFNVFFRGSDWKAVDQP